MMDDVFEVENKFYICALAITMSNHFRFFVFERLADRKTLCCFHSADFFFSDCSTVVYFNIKRC